MTVTLGTLEIDWYGYATIRLTSDDRTVYFDPGRYGVLTGEWEPDTSEVEHPPGRDVRPEDGDLVCVTHLHHYDPDGIDRVAAPDATVLVHEAVHHSETDRDVVPVEELPYEVRRVDDETQLTAAGLPIWTIAAYNEPDGPHTRANGEPYHPEGWGCGYLVEIGGRTVCWPGDTDVLAGHAELDASVLLPPIGGSFTMDRQEAAALADELRPDLVVPVHYNTFDALETDPEAFGVDVASSGVPVAFDHH